MAKITEKQLIESLRQLKEIKPRREWAVLLKSQILSAKDSSVKTEIQAKQVSFKDAVFALLFQKKLAYSLATMLFVIVGLIGFAQQTVPGDLLFPIKKISEQSGAALTGQPQIKQNVAVLNNRINELAQVAKTGKTNNIPSAISEVNTNAKDLAQSIKDSPIKDLETLKEISQSLKTLAAVEGADLAESQGVKDLYKIVVENQITDLKETTLTEEQEQALLAAEQMYEQGEYADALEAILLISLN